MIDRPWLQYYSDSARSWTPRYGDMLSAFRAAVAAGTGGINYWGAFLSWGDIDVASDRLAARAAGQGLMRGDRLAILLQNTPDFAIAVVAAWKIGAIPMPGNSMYRSPELLRVFADARPAAILCHDDHLAEVKAALSAADLTSPVLLVSPAEHAGSAIPEALARPTQPGDRLADILSSPADPPVQVTPAGDDLGLLLYTSGTTGEPKGAMIRHESLAKNGQHTADWCAITPASRILGVAPLFHVTGFVCQLCAAIIQACDLILFYRFDASLALEIIRRERPTFAIGAVTAFNALAFLPDATPADFASFDHIFSGGAPIAPSLQEELGVRMGLRVHNCFGMTETTAPTHFTPLDLQGPVDPASGALSIGVPGYGTDAKIIDDDGRDLPPGEVGELCLRGEQVMSGYWNKPGETAATLADGWMRSGDIAFMDADGWFFLVDRKKDMINASGFKVWPREVEDALYAHAAVREAAVVGEPDSYRGETVVAYVSLRAGERIDPDDLVAHCRARLAGYKCPRSIHIVDDLPKTITGKVQRNLVRELHRA